MPKVIHDTPAKKKAARAKTVAKRIVTKRKEKGHQKELHEAVSERGIRNKYIRDEDLRLRLDGKKTVDRINTIIEEFTVLDQQIRNAKNTKKSPNRLNNRIKKATARGTILKTQADMLFKKLGKLLPDVKSVEQSSITKNTKPENLPDDKLVDIIKDNVPMEEVIEMFPQYKDLLETLDEMEVPELPN